LSDFTTTARIVVVAAAAVVLGVVNSFVAWGLLRLIGFFTNLFFFGRLSTALTSPKENSLGPAVILIPVAGALIIGFMARYGSERIRGHGIPEAIEAILMGGSRVQPRVAILKPLSSAISIGSGGPFGAEGPIILTGGAVGSLAGQFFELTSAERKTLLVAGAAAGMAATFATPVAAVLLAVELLLFELKPRSLVPVGLASVAAAVTRRHLLGLGPIFPTVPHSPRFGLEVMIFCVLAGLAAGASATVLTAMVYEAEDRFQHLPIHWMWWPAIGGLVIGVGGFIYPPALGVGYDVIETTLRGDATFHMILGILLVKSVIWAVALGSGTSGGVLAPLLMIGGGLGALEGHIFPSHGPGFWPLISMAAVLGGTMRAPLTATIFTLELTHDGNLLLPLLCGAIVAHGFTVLTMKRSILTEKVSRRGFHLSREYSVDPLETTFVRDVMRRDLLRLPAEPGAWDAAQIRALLARQALYPVTDAAGHLAGVLPRSALDTLLREDSDDDLAARAQAHIDRNPTIAFADESLRVIAYRMAEHDLTRLPVLDRRVESTFVGIVSLRDLIKARKQRLDEEIVRERVLTMRFRDGTLRRARAQSENGAAEHSRADVAVGSGVETISLDADGDDTPMRSCSESTATEAWS
jgi:H+/Cl- antiporter ClcA/CBS domain-containing protein